MQREPVSRPVSHSPRTEPILEAWCEALSLYLSALGAAHEHGAVPEVVEVQGVVREGGVVPPAELAGEVHRLLQVRRLPGLG